MQNNEADSPESTLHQHNSRLVKRQKAGKISRTRSMNILLSSYSFGAYRGSEAGVGWNIATGLARRGHSITVLTTSEFSHLNHPALASEKLNIRLVEKDFGIKNFASAKAYRHWQNHVHESIREEEKANTFDLIHHITFNQYRNIRDVFASKLPFLIGPIGGAEVIPIAILWYGNLPLGMRMKEILRYCPLDILPLIHRCKYHDAKGKIIASNQATAQRLAGIACPIEISPAIAIHESEITETHPRSKDEDAFILFDGGLSRAQKGTYLALRALSRLWKKGHRYPIRMVGVNTDDNSAITHYAEQHGLPPNALQLYPPVSRETMLGFMLNASVMLSTVYRDSGSMALLEALSKGCRIVCLNIPSQNWLPDDFCRRVEVCRTSHQMEISIADALYTELKAPPHSPEWHQKRVQWLSSTMTWHTRLNALEKHYASIL